MGRRDPKSGRIICTLCQKVRMEERGQVAASFTMRVELLAGLDIEADRLLISRNQLLSAIAQEWLYRQREERR